MLAVADFEEYAWEERVMRSINAPCLGYVVQTSNIKWMVQSFARMYHNPRAEQRYNRTFLYLPVVSRLMSDAEFEQHVSEVFHLEQMTLMPDLDIVKLVQEMCSANNTLHSKSYPVAQFLTPAFYQQMSSKHCFHMSQPLISVTRPLQTFSNRCLLVIR